MIAVIPPMTITLRQPDYNKAELVITEPGGSLVKALSYAQVKMLNRQTAQALEHWPVAEVPSM